MSDKYCYPDTNILKNMSDIHDKNELFCAEIELTANRLMELQVKPVKGRFDFNHLCKIHQHIFQDLYDWAGQPRTVNIGKNNLFCLVQNIPSYANYVFGNYYRQCKQASHDKDQFAKTLADNYADLNALHPFREGNGRSQREFAREVCLDCGYAFDLSHTCHQDMLEASIASFDRMDNTKLAAIFQQSIIPLDQYTPNPDVIQILSKDDIPDRGRHVENTFSSLLSNVQPSDYDGYSL